MGGIAERFVIAPAATVQLFAQDVDVAGVLRRLGDHPHQ